MAVKAALSVFHGPMVESNFSLMSEIIDSRSGSMNISTLSAIQTVKHTTLTRKQTALQMFETRPEVWASGPKNVPQHHVGGNQRQSSEEAGNPEGDSMKTGV